MMGGEQANRSRRDADMGAGVRILRSRCWGARAGALLVAILALGCRSTVEGRPGETGGIDWAGAEFIPPDLLVATRWSELGTYRVDALRIYEVERYKPATITTNSAGEPVSFGTDEGFVVSRPELDSPDVEGDFVEEGIEVRCVHGAVEPLEFGWMNVSRAAAGALGAGGESFPVTLQISVGEETLAMPFSLEEAATVICSESAAESDLERTVQVHRLLHAARDREDSAVADALEAALERDQGRLVSPLDSFDLDLLVEQGRMRAPDGTVIDFRAPEQVGAGDASDAPEPIGEIELEVVGEPNKARTSVSLKVTAANPLEMDVHQVIAIVSGPGLGFLLVPLGRVSAGQAFSRFVEARVWRPALLDTSALRVVPRAFDGAFLLEGAGEVRDSHSDLDEWEPIFRRADSLRSRWIRLAEERPSELVESGSVEGEGSPDYRAWCTLIQEQARLCVELDEKQPLEELIAAVRRESAAEEEALRSAMRACGREEALAAALIELDVLWLTEWLADHRWWDV